MAKGHKSSMDKTNRCLGNLIKLLPTGTVFTFQFLSPVLSNNGHCHPFNRLLTAVLVASCGFSCAFSCFTDSYHGTDSLVHYGLVTSTGLWPHPFSGSADMSRYKLRLGDIVHALYSVMVFAVVSLLDPNTVRCLYPALESSQKVLTMLLPPVVGVITGLVFMAFPNKRHGIGYPASSKKELDSSDDEPHSTPALRRNC